MANQTREAAEAECLRMVRRILRNYTTDSDFVLMSAFAAWKREQGGYRPRWWDWAIIALVGVALGLILAFGG